ncbi:MAG TPA: hypothetical protein DEO85_14545 [Maritimibacter sp.]|nr:hypothetical protein [Maritimibacter sp.]
MRSRDRPGGGGPVGGLGWCVGQRPVERLPGHCGAERSRRLDTGDPRLSGGPPHEVGLHLCADTSLRPGEVTGLRWTDVDWEARQINIPAERMKLSRPHVVPLSTQVEEFPRSVHPLTGRDQYILTFQHTKGRPLNNNTHNAALRRLGYSKEEMVAHGSAGHTARSEFVGHDHFGPTVLVHCFSQEFQRRRLVTCLRENAS